MLRYSLGTLLLGLLYLSIGFGALANASAIWLQIAVTLSVAILLLFTLAAIVWTERRRVFAIGFAVAGWLYFVLVFAGLGDVRSYLLTQTATDGLYVMMHGQQQTSAGRWVTLQTLAPGGAVTTKQLVYPAPPVPRVAGQQGPRPTTVYGQPAPALAYRQPTPALTYVQVAVAQTVDSYLFANIGHSIWAVIVAFVGGVVAQLLFLKNQRNEQA